MLYNEAMEKFLNIVDEDDQIIGQKTKEEIHVKGFFHREVHVYFITLDKELIFQHRAKDKDLFPDLLDATVGGHVEIGHSYEETAVKEAEEETGVNINPVDLIFVNKIKKYSIDKATGKINNVFNSRYLYVYRGRIEDLRVEKGKALGFELWPLEKILNINNNEKDKFIPYILEFSSTELVEFIKNLNL